MNTYHHTRCPGAYEGVDGEFGVTLRLHCIDCIRRTAPMISPRMSAPEFGEQCPDKLTDRKQPNGQK